LAIRADIFLSLAALLLTAAAVIFLGQNRPFGVLFLTTSRAQQFALEEKLFKAVSPLSVVTLLDMRYSESHTSGEARQSFNNYRAVDEATWEDVVYELADLSPIIVLDTRTVTSPMLMEARRVLDPNLAYKTFFLIGENGERPVLDVVLSHGAAVLQAGAPAFADVVFQYVAAAPTRSATMGKFMVGIYGAEGPKIAAGYPFERFNTLIDIGGGQGHIVAEILRQHPALQGALFDLPPTAAVARTFFAGQGLSHRCDVYAGDFFQAVPVGYDAYVIKSVLHDWDDEKAVQILRQCRDAMPSHGRVLVIETVVSPGKPMGHPHPMIDLEMMVTFGGKERAEQEFTTLFSRAGLTLEKVTPMPGSFFSVVEATPV
jgi:hypothetical protein